MSGMSRILVMALILILGSLGQAKESSYAPTEKEISMHRREVYQIARDYIVDTFHLVAIEESHFNPVRFNSTGVWGDFHARVKELGDDRFEIRGWIYPVGHDPERIIWSVVLSYKLQDPEAWRYRRIDEDAPSNEPNVSSWRFGIAQSVPYEAEYSKSFALQYVKTPSP